MVLIGEIARPRMVMPCWFYRTILPRTSNLAIGWNVAPTALGERIMAEIVELVRAGAVTPVIGSVVAFEELPGLICDMANRRTTGRAIVLVS